MILRSELQDYTSLVFDFNSKTALSQPDPSVKKLWLTIPSVDIDKVAIEYPKPIECTIHFYLNREESLRHGRPIGYYMLVPCNKNEEVFIDNQLAIICNIRIVETKGELKVVENFTLENKTELIPTFGLFKEYEEAEAHINEWLHDKELCDMLIELCDDKINYLKSVKAMAKKGEITVVEEETASDTSVPSIQDSFNKRIAEAVKKNI